MVNRILLDIETQRDFFSPDGSCYRPQADKAATQIWRLFGWARTHGVPVISTVLRVRKFERGPLSCNVPYCVEDTEGEKKLAKAILPRRINLGLRNSTDLPGNIFKHYQQVIFEKRDTDIFAHARAERLITELPQSASFVICGAGISFGIVQAAVGLRSRGFGVILATDAVLELPDELCEMAYLRMDAKCVIRATTSEIVARVQPLRPFKISTPVAKQATRKL
jgi:nicotinamidase-related amidase